MDELERQQALAAFLRTRRTRLQPADVGLPARSRRRTPGLRREEVAELANIGVSWYTLLEQGHDVHPSRHVLQSLAQALRLTTAEEQHLFLLASQELPAKMIIEEAQVTPALQRVLDALTPHPAFLIGRRWDVLTWNRAADLLFHFHEPYPPHSRNVVWRFFQREEARKFDLDWERQAQNLVAQFPLITLAILAMTLFRKSLQTCSGSARSFACGGNNRMCEGRQMGRASCVTQR